MLRSLNRFPVTLLSAVLLTASSVQHGFAHGAVHEQIAAVSRELEKDPRNVRLLLQRGELYRVHQEWDAAQADFDTAAALGPKIVQIDLLRGRLFYEAGWNLSAKTALDRFLAGHTNHSAALVVRARVLTRLNKHLAAAEDYTRAIAVAQEPGPELYLEWSQAFAGAGADHLADAVRCLDEGIKRLGPLVTLELYAIDLEVKRKNFDGALGRLDGVARRAPRKETWLAKRGEILQAAARVPEARQAFQAALDEIDQLPPTRRNVPAVLELQKRLKEQLAALNDADTTSRTR